MVIEYIYLLKQKRKGVGMRRCPCGVGKAKRSGFCSQSCELNQLRNHHPAELNSRQRRRLDDLSVLESGATANPRVRKQRNRNRAELRSLKNSMSHKEDSWVLISRDGESNLLSYLQTPQQHQADECRINPMLICSREICWETGTVPTEIHP